MIDRRCKRGCIAIAREEDPASRDDLCEGRVGYSAPLMLPAEVTPMPDSIDRDRLYPEPLEPQAAMCRICLETDAPVGDPLIAPCKCAGTTKWVHRKCLDEWRSQEQVPLAFTHCPNCRFQYRTEIDRDTDVTRRVKLVLFVARDTIGLFMLMQAVIAATAFVVHVCDRNNKIASLYPEHWAETTAASHLAIGPYYVTTVIGYLAILGFVGMVLACTGRLPSARREARHPPRWRRRRSNDCCNGCQCDTDPFCCYYVSYSPSSGEACQCDQCCNCGDCGGGGDCSGDGAPAFLVVVVVIVVIFVVIGLVVGVFFSVIVVQRIIQRHVRLLHMRDQALTHKVLDLANSPELLEAPAQTLYRAPDAGTSTMAPLLPAPCDEENGGGNWPTSTKGAASSH